MSKNTIPFEDLQRLVDTAKPGENLEVEKIGFAQLPFSLSTESSPTLISALICRLTDSKSGQKWLAYLGYNGKTSSNPEFWTFTCRTKFLTGEVPKPDGEKFTEDALRFVHPDAKIRASIKAEVMKLHASFPPTPSCGYAHQVGRYGLTQGGCDHCRSILSFMKPDFDVVVKELKARNAAMAAGSYTALDLSEFGGSFSADPLMMAIRRISGKTTPAKEKVPFLVEGDQGGSKTFTCRSFAHDSGFDAFIEVGGYSDMEAFDFLGGMLPNPSGAGMIWLDGPVSQAWRLAAAGKKVCLLIDEIFRVPRRQRSLFLTALSPDRGVYRIKTGRPINVVDGIATMEVLEAPIQNISILATTNVGDDFEIEDDDPAMRERWYVFQRFVSEDLIKEILGPIITEKGYAPVILTNLLTFYRNMKKMKGDSQCKYAPSVRILARAVTLSKRQSEMQTILEGMIPMWASTNASGMPVEEQVKDIKNTISKAFGSVSR